MTPDNLGMLFQNSTGQLVLITDVKLAGKSILDDMRADLLQRGKLEDPADQITLLPNESLQFYGDQIEWREL